MAARRDHAVRPGTGRPDPGRPGRDGRRAGRTGSRSPSRTDAPAHLPKRPAHGRGRGLHNLLGRPMEEVASERPVGQPEPILRLRPDQCADGPAGRVQRACDTRSATAQRTGTITVTSPRVRHSVTDAAIQHFLQHEISVNADFPRPGPNTLYFVYLPPGVSVSQGGDRSCQAFCGYHNDVIGRQRSSTRSCPSRAARAAPAACSALDALTSTSSHELCEAITDPIPGQGWYDDVQRRDRRHLRLEDQEAGSLTGAAGMVQQEEGLRLSQTRTVLGGG